MNQSPLELLALPHHGQVRHTLRTLKKRTDKPLQYVAVRGDWVCLYTSEQPKPAYSEWWLDILIGRGLSVESTTLTLPQEDGHFRCIYIEQGVVRQIWEETSPNWHGIAFQHASTHYLVQTDVDEHVDTSTFPGQEIDAPSDKEWGTLNRYDLTSPKRSKLWPLVGTAAVCALGGALWLSQLESPVKTAPAKANKDAGTAQAVSLPSWMLYRLALNEAINGGDALDKAMHIAAYCGVMPSGWVCEGITQQGEALTVNVHRQPNGLVNVWTAWLNAYPEIGNITSSSLEAPVVSQPLAVGLPHWQEHVVSMDVISRDTLDALTLFSMTVTTEAPVQEPHWQRQTWQVSHAGLSLGQLKPLISLLNTLPASMSGLTLTPNADGMWALNFSMTLYGGQ